MNEKEVKEEKIVSFKDYVPPSIEEIEDEYRVHILEDIRGTKFQFKHRIPTTREVLEFRGIINELSDDGKTIKTNFVKGFDFINKVDFNPIPSNLKVDHLTEQSVKEVVLGFCKRV